MDEPLDYRVARVEKLVEVARRIADPRDPFGVRARQELESATGLSIQGIELGLAECLEHRAVREDLVELCQSVPCVSRAHVLLSANVFVAQLRALALAVAASPRVEVRQSRREPVMAAIFHEGSRGVFRLVPELAPLPGEHVWAYGANDTLRALRSELPAGVVLHAHRAGLGVVVVEPLPTTDEASLADWARRIALDVVPFDQRGCASPRTVLVQAPPTAAGRAVTQALAAQLARELARLEHEIPRGVVSEDEVADFVRYRDLMLYVANALPAGKGVVGVDSEGTHFLIPPTGRNLHVARVDDAAGSLLAMAELVVSAGVEVTPTLGAQLREALPMARIVPLGTMQRPRLDGPLDRRSPPEGETL